MALPVKTSTILDEVFAERRNQDNRWGEQNHDPLYWLAILTEEFGEVGKALAEGERYQYRAELIHVAAVAVAAVESYDRANR